MKKLKINKDFANLIPPLSKEEFAQLEQNILQNRCQNAIKTWRGFIVDGHNRYEICTRHNIPFPAQALRFSSEEEAKIWIAENQLGRRNLTDALRIEIAAKKLAFSNSTNKRKAIAQSAGVSEQTVQRYMKILSSGTAELLQKVRNGETKIGTAFNSLPGKMQTKTTRNLFTATPQELATGQLNYLEKLYASLSTNCNEIHTLLKEHLKTIDAILRANAK
jgi:transcriptional regulator with XRE-family HTH domain